MGVYWSDLHLDVLELIELSIDDLIDFSETCSYWHNVVVECRGSFRRRISIPWVMITDKKRRDLCVFFSPLRPRSFYEFPLPYVDTKRCMSSRGWIMTVGRYGSGKVQLFNPLSRARACAELPPLGGLGKPVPINKFALSSCPVSSVKSEIMVLCDNGRQLGLWNHRDQSWTIVGPCRIYMDLIFHEGRFLAVDAGGTVRAFHAKRDGLNPATDVVPMPRESVDGMLLKKHYLVECSGTVLVVSQEWQRGFTSGFRTFLLDLEARTWTKVDSLGNRSLFLGLNSSFSMEVSPQHRGIEPNCIYFTDDRTYDRTQGKDMGIYRMADGRVEPLFDSMSDCPNSTPLWIEPNVVPIGDNSQLRGLQWKSGMD